MDLKKVGEYRKHLSNVDHMVRDARDFDDSVAFLGYKESFKEWVKSVIGEIQRNTPAETGSGAFEAATRALDDLAFPMDVKFSSLIRNLQEALERAIQFHSALSIANLKLFMDACAKIKADPEKTMAEFCKEFSRAIEPTTRAGIPLTLQVTTQPE